MNLNEVLKIFGQELNEVDISKVNKRLKKYIDSSDSAKDLASKIKTDGSLEQSMQTGITGSPEEQSKYKMLLKDPMVSQAINSLSPQLKNLFKTAADNINVSDPPEGAQAQNQFDPLTGLDKEAKYELSMMQQQLSGISAGQKEKIIRKWLQDPVKSRLYKFGKKEGLF